MPTLLTAGDASNGAVITSSNDNALTIQTGAAGAKVNAIALASDGTATLLQPPKLAASATVSMVRVHTGNGFGSTNTKINRFTTVVTNQGSDITYADSATLGASFTINTSGVYAITHHRSTTPVSDIGISLNTTEPTVGIASLTVVAERVALSTTATGQVTSSGTTMYLPAGSVIRPHSDGGADSASPNRCQFTIVRVA